MKRKNAFTLIELIAVLVILAILALIVTSLVLNIVRKAKDSANKRSIDAYGKAVELSIATYLLDNGAFPICESDLKIEYSGNEVNCNIMNLNENGSVYLSECTVSGNEVKDSSNDDGFYHYGRISVSSIKSVVDKYKIGDIVTYKGMDFYVIADSDENSDSVTMLKAEPLSVDEINIYGKDHVNKYTYSSVGMPYSDNGYGSIAYYSSSTCGYPQAGNANSVTTGCTTDYASSDVKHIIDAWTADKFNSNDLVIDSLGYKSRLITYEELLNNLGYKNSIWYASYWDVDSEYVPDWVYNKNYTYNGPYWTMSSYNDSMSHLWNVGKNGELSGGNINGYMSPYVYMLGNVRPVISIYKVAIENNSNIVNLKCN